MRMSSGDTSGHDLGAGKLCIGEAEMYVEGAIKVMKTDGPASNSAVVFVQ